MPEAEMLGSVTKDEASGLHVLTSGPIPPNPAELLGSDQMRKLIAVLGAQFTHIVIDSPPVSSFTDGVLIASMVDGVLLVVYGGKSSPGGVLRSLPILTEVGAKNFGLVVDKLIPRSRVYFYYFPRYYDQNYYNHD